MTRPAPHLALLLAALLACASAPAPAQPPADIALPIAPPAPVDWPGTLTLAVDATDLDHRVLQVRQTVPVAPGRLTLLYPRWLPGTHGPYADLDRVAGPTITAAGQTLHWRRDTAEPHALHVDVPDGVTELALRYDVVTPLAWRQGRPSMTRALLGVQWDEVVFYPAGHAASHIRYAPSVKLPAGWRQASALRDGGGAVAEPDAEGWVRFGPVSLETLIDSPLFAGPNLQRIALTAPGSAAPVVLNLLGDTPELITATEKQLDAHRALVTQASRVFGPGHWRHYDFLLAVSDSFGSIGLEHTESSENGVGARYFKNWDASLGGRDLLPHEFTHAWNGKYHRPAGLDTPNYNVPMRNELLWVYEGMTQYWG